MPFAIVSSIGDSEGPRSTAGGGVSDLARPPPINPRRNLKLSPQVPDLHVEATLVQRLLPQRAMRLLVVHVVRLLVVVVEPQGTLPRLIYLKSLLVVGMEH